MVSDKVVLHFDMDSFYCQVESRRLGVSQSAPLVVDQWGMLLSVNYPAKALGISRKTPAQEAASMGAIVVHVCVVDIETGEKFDDINSAYRERTMYKASLDRYREASEEVMTVMKQALTERASFERASIDECFVDISGSDLEILFPELPEDLSRLGWEKGVYDVTMATDGLLARGALLGERIRSEVFAVTGFTASCGVSLTRQVAKLSCALNKPNKLTVVCTTRTSEFMRAVPIRELRGLGPRGMELLKERIPWVSGGSTLSGDLWSVDLGKDDFGKWLFEAVRGLNDDPVKETGLVAGSVGSSKQFRPPLKFELVEGMLRSLTSDMLERLGSRTAKTLMVTLQSGDTVRTRQEKFPQSSDEVYETVKQLSEKSGLLRSGFSGFDRLAVAAKDVDTEERETARRQVAEYLFSSRLHFMGTWRSRYLDFIRSVEESGEWPKDAWISEESCVALNNLINRDGGSFDTSSSSNYLLVDMDCFFCCAGMLARGMTSDSNFEGSPVAVASGLGATSEICSANYTARKFGISARNFVGTAREKCPDLIVLAIDRSTLTLCESIWKKVIRILSLVNGIDSVAGRSCDEALVELPVLSNLEAAEKTMKTLQKIVLNECKVPCSVGIAPTRILAKIATTAAKPRGTFTFASVAQGCEFLLGKSVKVLPGVGINTQQKLKSAGIETVADLVNWSPSELGGLVGHGIAKKLLSSARGLDILEDFQDEKEKDCQKTVSAEKNFGLRNLSLDQASDLLAALCESVENRCGPDCEIEKVSLKLKMAGPDWVEPAKKGGIGDAMDWSRSVVVPKKKNGKEKINGFHAFLSPLLREIDSSRIRGIGVAAKIAHTISFNNNHKLTIKDVFAGKLKDSPPLPALPKQLEQAQENGGITDACILCGAHVLLGHLTDHLLTHPPADFICPCPICGDLIDLADSASHTACHFTL